MKSYDLIEIHKALLQLGLEEYPDEDLWEDGELNNMQVGLKLLQLWQRGDIMIVRKVENVKRIL